MRIRVTYMTRYEINKLPEFNLLAGGGKIEYRGFTYLFMPELDEKKQLSGIHCKAILILHDKYSFDWTPPDFHPEATNPLSPLYNDFCSKWRARNMTREEVVSPPHKLIIKRI